MAPASVLYLLVKVKTPQTRIYRSSPTSSPHTKMSSLDLPAEYQTAEGLRTLANFLRSQNGVKSRSGIEHEKRVDYFKGE